MRQTTPPVRAGLLAIAGVIFLLGLSLYVFPRQTDTLFAWTIKVPLTAAFLGASYWASTTLAVACAGERAWVCARAFAPPYLIAGVVLLWVTIVHIDLFHMDDLTGWLWLVLYAVFPPTTIALLLRQVRVPGADPPRTAPMPAAAMLVLGLQGGIMVALGLALIVAPLDAASLWPWPLTALTGQAIGVFVLAQGVLLWTACRERDWTRVRPAMIQYVVLAVLQLGAVARFPGTLDWDSAGAWLYLALPRRRPGHGALRRPRGAGGGAGGPLGAPRGRRRSSAAGSTWRRTRKGALMGDGTADEIKGRTKEAAGDLTDDKSLKNEGKVDRATGSVKDTVGDAGDKLKDAVNPDR